MEKGMPWRNLGTSSHSNKYNAAYQISVTFTARD